MPEKPGNGGHGLENYDPKTGKYIESNGSGENLNNVINEQKKAENIFGLNFGQDNNYFNQLGESNVKSNFQETVVLSDNNQIDYPEYIMNNETGQVIFVNPEDINRYLQEVCEKIAWKNLVGRTGQSQFEVDLCGEKRILRSPQDLYQYYKDFSDEVHRKNFLHKGDPEWYLPDDITHEEKEQRVLNKLGLSSVDELFEKYNQLQDNMYRVGENVKQERKVVVTTGLPAAGKSLTGSHNELLAGLEVDSDMAKKMLDAYVQDPTMVSVVQSYSAAIRDIVLSEAIKRGCNLSITTIGMKKNMEHFIKLFKDNGYDMQIANIFVPFEQNISRSIFRLIKTNRLTTFEVIAKHLGSQEKNVREIIEEFNLNGKNSGISGYAFIDNTNKPQITESKGFAYDSIIK